MRTAPFLFLITFSPLFAAGPSARPLFLPTDANAVREIRTSDSRLRVQNSGKESVLQVATGHQKQYPGLTIKAPSGFWDLSTFGQIDFHLRNPSQKRVTVNCRVDCEALNDCDTMTTVFLRLQPGSDSIVTVPLVRTGFDDLGGKLFGMLGYPARLGGPKTLNPAAITELHLFVTEADAEHLFEIVDIHARGEYVPPVAWSTDATPFFPFVDAFGQYRHKDWPGKVRSEQDMITHRDREAAALAADPGPAGWNQYGGWANGPRQKATGFFRTAKVDGKWWLVDPEGCLFFSTGIDCVGLDDATLIEGRRDWFADFPGNEPRFRQFLGRHRSISGHYAGRTAESFNFLRANYLRKYGPDWPVTYPKLVHQRLRAWGVNTLGNWSNESIWSLRQTPYVVSLHTNQIPRIEGDVGGWHKLPDVFTPDFAEKVKDGFRQATRKTAGDPWCLGYFCDNELGWSHGEVDLSLSVLASPAEQPAKREFLSHLQRKYQNIRRLNAAWGTDHASWQALASSTSLPDKEQARPDLAAFYAIIADRYFRTVSRALKELAPQQLYLGCRFQSFSAAAETAAARYCDVVSYNHYVRDLDNFRFGGVGDVPLLIGEYHFGALDRGLFYATGLPAIDQADRARLLETYLLSALRHPQFVGCHWFQYHDEPLTARSLDEENSQIGFVDVADNPYPEMSKASRRFGEHMYVPAAHRPPLPRQTSSVR